MPKASEIAAFLGSELKGVDFEVSRPCSLKNPTCRGLSFRLPLSEATRYIYGGCPWKTETITKALFLVKTGEPFVPSYSGIAVPNPRLAFGRCINEFWKDLLAGGRVQNSIDTYWRRRICVCDGAWVGDCVDIGKNCFIKANSVIGQAGFGFEYNEQGTPERIPHIGGVVIEDDVEVGANTVIARGAIDDTIIGRGTKIDDACFIAHNVRIGENCLIIAHTEISGSVEIGDNCIIGPSACIADHVHIGNNAHVGIGAVVVCDVPDNEIWVGNPAKFLRRK